MKKIANNILKTLGILFFLSIAILIGVYSYKYYITNKIINSNNIETYRAEITTHNDIMYETGNIGNYPTLRISNDSGKSWKKINVRGLLWDAYPTGSHFNELKKINNTVWFEEIESCIECDFSNRWHNIFYSHDNGKTWNSIDQKYIQGVMVIDFENDNNGRMVSTFSTDPVNYYTNDGGKNWIEKNSN